jgi:hypothetical protein
VSALQSGSGAQDDPYGAVAGRRVSGLACLAVLAAALLGLVGAQSAAASITSDTPSTTEPFRACPMATLETFECEEITMPAAYVRSRKESGAITPDEEGTGEEGGWSPENLKHAYKLPEKGGSGETVAIVDAFNHPEAETDLNVYREHYKLYYNSTAKTFCTRADGCFEKLNQKGESSANETSTIYPEPNPGWAKEMTLDIDMVSAICPECKIDLVEAENNDGGVGAPLDIAEDEAASLKPAAVSNSWGSSGESSTEAEEDVYFDHPGIPIVFAAGTTPMDRNIPRLPST